MEEQVEIDIDKRVERDLAYIRTEIIARQIDGNLCKWSRPLNAVAIVGLTDKQYMDYWRKQYKYYPEYLDELLVACYDKLSNGLTPRQTLITMIQNSNDFESEKEKAIKALGGKYAKRRLVK